MRGSGFNRREATLAHQSMGPTRAFVVIAARGRRSRSWPLLDMSDMKAGIRLRARQHHPDDSLVISQPIGQGLDIPLAASPDLPR